MAEHQRANRRLSDEERTRIEHEQAEWEAARPSATELLRTDQLPWFFLADPEGLRAAITEVGSGDDHAGLASLVVTYTQADTPIVQVGWSVRPQRPALPAQEDDDLTRSDLARRLILTVFATLHRTGADRGEIVQRVNASPPTWDETILVVDGHEHPAWTATAADSRLTYAHLDDQTVFVQSVGWSGPIALRSSLQRPRLPDA